MVDGEGVEELEKVVFGGIDDIFALTRDETIIRDEFIGQDLVIVRVEVEQLQ